MKGFGQKDFFIVTSSLSEILAGPNTQTAVAEHHKAFIASESSYNCDAQVFEGHQRVCHPSSEASAAKEEQWDVSVTIEASSHASQLYNYATGAAVLLLELLCQLSDDLV